MESATYADMVINHNSGADEEEVNPLDGQKRWTKFNPKSGRFPRDWNCFHPCRYEQVMMRRVRTTPGFRICAIAIRVVYAAMFEYARMVIEELWLRWLSLRFRRKGYRRVDDRAVGEVSLRA